MSIDPFEAFFIGLIGGAMYGLGTLLTTKLRLDEPTDAISCHLFVGLWGMLAPAFFHTHDGVFHGGAGVIIGVQLVAFLCIVGWAAVFGAVTCGILAVVRQLRIDIDVEMIGLNNCGMTGRGYAPAAQSVQASHSSQDEQDRLRPTTGRGNDTERAHAPEHGKSQSAAPYI
jgi:Amt family ammonium transporter